MPAARYFVPDHPKLTDVYTRDELRLLLQKGELSRSEIICDDETGLAHLLGDLLSTPYPQATSAPTRSTDSTSTAVPVPQEFRASTPLSRPESDFVENDDDDDWDNPEEEDLDDISPESEDDLADQDEDAVDTFRGLDDDDSPDSEADLENDPSFEQDDDGAYPPAQSILADDEELLYFGHPSWFAYPKILIGFCLCSAVAFFCWRQHYGLDWMILFASAAGLFLLYIALERASTSFFVTPRRVEMEFGIVGRSSKEVRITDIRAIDVKQTGFAALIGLGTVSFDSAASGSPEVTFKNVRGPHRIKDLVRSLQR